MFDPHGVSASCNSADVVLQRVHSALKMGHQELLNEVERIYQIIKSIREIVGIYFGHFILVNFG